MSLAVDANILVYASDPSSPFHERAAEALDGAATGTELLYVFWPVAMAYLRIATHPSVASAPLTPAEATANVESLLARPNVRSPGERDGFWTTFRRVAGEVVLRGNLVPDAHLVTLMRQWGVRTIITHDRDFRRFDGVRVSDPFART